MLMVGLPLGGGCIPMNQIPLTRHAGLNENAQVDNILHITYQR
jgi:hypothetical protein